MSGLTSQDIDAVCDLVSDLCGVYWDASKEYLIESRLGALLKSQGCSNYTDFAKRVRSSICPALTADVIDAVTTHETMWFRDTSPFEALRHKLFPELVDAKRGTPNAKRFRIWSAACSTGQEPYSVAMTLSDLIPDIHSWDIQILGTDISEAAVATASRGVFRQLEMSRGMDSSHLSKYFVKQGAEWRVCDEIRALCSFDVRNLHWPFSALGPFDVIFCRNVVIYFTPDDRRDIFGRMARTLQPNGWLIVGSSESLADLGPQWTPQFHCRANCYRPNALAPTLA